MIARCWRLEGDISVARMRTRMRILSNFIEKPINLFPREFTYFSRDRIEMIEKEAKPCNTGDIHIIWIIITTIANSLIEPNLRCTLLTRVTYTVKIEREIKYPRRKIQLE